MTYCLGLGYCYGGRNCIGGCATYSDINSSTAILVSAATGANTVSVGMAWVIYCPEVMQGWTEASAGLDGLSCIIHMGLILKWPRPN